MRIRVAFRDKVGKDFTIKEIRRIERVSEKDTERLAKACEKVIRETIFEKADKPSGNLASGFYAHKIIDGWAVGDIEELDKNLPYWNHVDKGSEGIGANWQHFLPKGYWLDGRWVVDSKGFSGIQPQSPIQPLNYIASTLQKMEIQIPRILKG